jgi:tetratricopeptide (TPR) repeat protein
MSARTGAEERPLDLTLAGLHLRTGSLGLARAELEALAGAGLLDPDGLADLAEARWRTGDLAGAGDAAHAHLDGGGESLVALVVAAEATAEVGRPSEARSFAAQALERLDRPLERILAGMPRSPIWPADLPEIAQPPSEAPVAAPTVPSVTAPPIGSDADRAVASARAALADGDLAGAAIQLAVAVRLAPLLAPAILELADDYRSPGLDLVRGDALAALGRETEARRAWADALAGPPTDEERS